MNNTRGRESLKAVTWSGVLLEGASMRTADSMQRSQHVFLWGALHDDGRVRPHRELIESGRVVDAAAGIVAALGSCRCDKAREFLRDAQLGSSPEEEEQLLRLWTEIFSSVRQEQSAATLAVCFGSGEDLSAATGTSGSLVAGRVQQTGTGDLSRVDIGPTDSAVGAGSGASVVGSGLRHLVPKVGSALVSGLPEPVNQIQAYGEKKVKNCDFVPAAVPKQYQC